MLPGICAGEFINRNLTAGTAILVPASPAPYKTPAFDFSRFTLGTHVREASGYVARVEESVVPAPPPGFELAGSFAPTARPTPMPLSFSGRFVRVYRRATPDTR